MNQNASLRYSNCKGKIEIIINVNILLSILLEWSSKRTLKMLVIKMVLTIAEGFKKYSGIRVC